MCHTESQPLGRLVMEGTTSDKLGHTEILLHQATHTDPGNTTARTGARGVRVIISHNMSFASTTTQQSVWSRHRLNCWNWVIKCRCLAHLSLRPPIPDIHLYTAWAQMPNERHSSPGLWLDPSHSEIQTWPGKSATEQHGNDVIME